MYINIPKRLCLALASLALSSAAFAQVSYFSASLEGSQEVPPVSATGTGFGIVRLDEPANTVNIFMHVEGLSGTPTAAHMHSGAAGTNGGVQIPFTGGPADFTGSATLTAAQVVTLKTAGNYLNVHTAANPGGELRGQVLVAASTFYTAVLNGANEVPPTGATGTGTVAAYLHTPDNRLVYDVNTTGLVNVTAAHIHIGAAGTNGAVIHPLIGSNGSYCGVTDRLTAAQVTALTTGGLYVNVHTAVNPNGEIRGQLGSNLGNFVTTLSAANEVPPTSSTATGTMSLTIDANGMAMLVANTQGLTGPATAAHIHQGAAGTNGGVIIPLTVAGPNLFTGMFTPSATDLASIRAGNTYMNIHTGANPNGEIRGQIGAAALPSTFGGGCTGSNGIRPEIGADAFPAIGTSFTVQLHGGLASTFAVLGLGFGRDSSGAITLPAAFTSIGLPAPNCYFLIDPAATSGTLTDSRGCASNPISLPFLPGLRGVDFYGQYFVFDAPANTLGLVSSTALFMHVQ